eukprot:gene5656-7218_t
MILEQISEEMEQIEKAKNSDGVYGVVAQLTILRCMKGMSLSQFTKENKEVAGKIMTMASDNYPELMAKCYLVNCPWYFSTVYAFAKMFLAAKTVAKISVLGSDFLKYITTDVELSSVPDFLGGQMTVFNE